MKDDWNLKEHIVMRYHHMWEEGFYPEDAVDKLREKLQEELARKELTSSRINELFGEIDTDHMKEFWEKRAKEHELNESMTNLEDDEELLKLKIKDEESKILPYVDWKDKEILDLGSGWGSWAFKFLEQGAKSVTCVDYVKEMCEKGRKVRDKWTLSEKRRKAIKFVNESVQNFVANKEYDIIFLSGISVYLSDLDYKKLVENIKAYSKKGTILILRDTTGVPKRYSFDKEYSERLDTLYSGIYRSEDEYKSLFKRAGFELVKSEDMFPEGHPLNRFPKTRLRLYKFIRNE